MTDVMLRRWVDGNVSEFEYTLLWLATYDLEAWRLISKVVCRDSRGMVAKDFVQPRHNAYYEVVREARTALPNVDAVGQAVFATVADALAQRGDRVGRGELPALLELYALLASCNYKQMYPLVVRVLDYWIGKQRASDAMTRAIGSADWDASNLLNELTAEVGFTRQQLRSDDHVSELINVVLNQQMPDTSGCMSTGLQRYDMALGGGFYRKEANLVIGAPGVGKTVFATQIALNAAISRRVVAYITTEQPVEELTCRWLSNWCAYSFGNVSRGFTFAKLPQEVQKKFLRLAAIIRSRLFIFDWKKNRKAVTSGGIEEEIAIAAEKAGAPVDMVVLDWLGGGLTDDCRDDKDKKRMALQNTADRMADIATSQNLTAVVMAQAHKVKGVNNMYVGVAEVPENKTLDQAMSTVTGLTGMFNPEARDAIKAGGSPDGADLYAKEQFFFVSKGRKSRGGHAAVLRNFKYQRYEDKD